MSGGKLTAEDLDAAYGEASQARVSALISDIVDSAERRGCSLLELARACDACAATAREAVARRVAEAHAGE